MGEGLAAALVLGAAGAMLGTRFVATPEANIAPWRARAIVEGGARKQSEAGSLTLCGVEEMAAQVGGTYPPQRSAGPVAGAGGGARAGDRDKCCYQGGV